jgi:bile acid:Na+ symporter, BASS family
MTEVLMLLLKISLFIFMAGNLLHMGLRLHPRDAFAGLSDIRFIIYTLVWGFVLGPALAYSITLVVPLAEPYALGLILMGMAPCAPFAPVIIHKAKGDLGYTAALMLLTAVGTVAFMPVAVPLMAKGLTASAWAIGRPLLTTIFLPLAIGMVVVRVSPALASKLEPWVKKVAGQAAIVMGVLCLIVYGKPLLWVPGSLAVLAQLIFLFVLTACPYWFAFGLKHNQKIVLSVGMTTRNLGAVLAPLFSIPEMDQRAIVMVVLGLPLMLIVAMLSAKWFGPRASKH